VPLLSGSGYTILPTADSIRVAWIPVLKDPTATANSTNQIAGRYGFWIDDENNKININTAYGKPAGMTFTSLTPGTIGVNGATYPLGHPSSVNLDVLNFAGNNIDLAGLATAVANEEGLKSIDEAKAHLSGGSPDAFFNGNKFYLTAYSRNPEFNAFGKPRLYFLRSVVSRQLGYPTFQYFRDRDASSIFSQRTKMHRQRIDIRRITPRRRSRPTSTAMTGLECQQEVVVDKWGGNAAAQREADQVAWNLVSLGSFAAGDFTGSSASGHYFELANAAASGELGFVSINRPNSDALLGALSGKIMLPAYPVPLINEVDLVITPESYTVSGGATHYRLHLSLNVELWAATGVSAVRFSPGATTIGMTYFMFHVTQAAPGTANSQQEDAKYRGSFGFSK